MTEYIVGLRLGKRSEVLTIEAEDALIAALKASAPSVHISADECHILTHRRRLPHSISACWTGSTPPRMTWACL
jgi:hypothetical protein